MHRDETPFATVCGVPLAVFAIPLDSSETGLTLDPSAEAQMGREFRELKYRRFVHVGKTTKTIRKRPPTGHFKCCSVPLFNERMAISFVVGLRCARSGSTVKKRACHKGYWADS
jgi:hypothetical protein